MADVVYSSIVWVLTYPVKRLTGLSINIEHFPPFLSLNTTYGKRDGRGIPYGPGVKIVTVVPVHAGSSLYSTTSVNTK